MYITNIKTIPVSHYLFVQVETDTGITGIGEIGVWGYLDAANAAVDKLSEYLIGKDPDQIEHHWNYMYRGLYFRGTVIMSAISAIDIALWDIKGKALGVPIYRLLGGKCREKVRSYAPVKQYDAESAADHCLKLKADGFTAARIMLNDKADLPQDPATFSGKVAHYVKKVQTCRQAVGDDFDLVLEIHRSMSSAEAIAFAKGVEACRPIFIEDPIPPDNFDQMALLAAKISLPVATGERFINIQEFEMLLGRGGAQYIRPDVCTVGGLTAAKKIAALAEAHYVSLVPHNPLGPVSTAACLQLDACIPNLLIQEHPSFNVDGTEDGLLKTPIQFDQGYIMIPDGPGLGIELADDIREQFPPKPRDFAAKIDTDGSVKDR